MTRTKTHCSCSIVVSLLMGLSAHLDADVAVVARMAAEEGSILLQHPDELKARLRLLQQVQRERSVVIESQMRKGDWGIIVTEKARTSGILCLQFRIEVCLLCIPTMAKLCHTQIRMLSAKLWPFEH